MEHPSKRRRIERRATGSLRAVLHLDGTKAGLRDNVIVPHLPKLTVPSTVGAINGKGLPNPSAATSRIYALRNKHLELRQVIPPPVTNSIDQAAPNHDAAKDATQTVGQTAANGSTPAEDQGAAGHVPQPIQQAAQPVLDQTPKTADAVTQPVQQAVQPIAGQAQQAGSNVIAPVNKQITQPTVDGIDKVPDAVTNKAATAPVSVPNPVQLVDNAPGSVETSAALAAAAARNKALAEQQAKAAKVDPNEPGSEGPAPAPIPSPSAGNDDQATPSQPLLSVVATPLLQTPTPSNPSSYGLSASQSIPTFTPTSALGSLASLSQMTSTNSTIPSSIAISTTPSTSLQTSSPVNSGSSSLLQLGAFTASVSSSIGQSMPSNSSTLPTSLTTSATATLFSSTPTDSSFNSGSSSLSNLVPASPSNGGLSGAGSPTSGGPASATTTAGSGSGSGEGSGAPPTGALVGGICGGVAGLVLVIAALLFLFRYRKRKYDQRREISPPIPQSAGAGSAALGGGIMTQRSSIRSTAPMAAAANLIGRLRPGSSQTATTTSTGHSEKGFQKLSGRKLPSVLQSGGDGYGEKSPAALGPTSRPPPRSIAPGQSPFAGLAPGLRPPSPQRSLSGSSFYRDSHGFYGGVGIVDPPAEDKTASSASPTSSSPTIPVGLSSGVPFAAAGHPPGQSSPGIPNMRPGPARQPVIQQGGIMPARTPSRPGTSQQRPSTSPIPEHPFPRDPLGRSRPSQDGSRQSRFRESTTPP